MLLTEDDCKTILKNYFPNNDHKYLNYNLKPISEDTEGFMGEHFKLTIQYESAEGREKSQQFFMKTKPRANPTQDEITRNMGMYECEIFIYEVLFKEFEKYGYDTSFASASYYCLPATALVLDDLSLSGYSITERHDEFSLAHVRCALRALALYHAAGYAYQARKTEERDVEEICSSEKSDSSRKIGSSEKISSIKKISSSEKSDSCGKIGSNEKISSTRKTDSSGKISSNEKISSSEKSDSSGKIGSNKKISSIEKISSSGKSDLSGKIGSNKKISSIEKISSSGKTASSGKIGSFEKISSAERKPYRLTDHFNDYLKETFFVQYTDPEGFAMKWWAGSRATILKLISLTQDQPFPGFKDLYLGYEFGKVFSEDTEIKKTCGHGDLWSNNLMFKYSGDQPVECRLLDFQLGRYFFPSLDVILLIFCNTNAEFRKQHLASCYKYYFQELSDILRTYGYSVDEIHPWEDFLTTIRMVMPDALTQVLLVYCIVSLPKQMITNMVQGEGGEGVGEIMFNNCDMVAEAFVKDAEYKMKLMEALTDFYDVLSKGK